MYSRDSARRYRGTDAAPDRRPSPRRDTSRSRRFLRRAARRVAVLVALFILYYATSLHGLGVRTLVLAGVLVVFLYWIFQDLL